MKKRENKQNNERKQEENIYKKEREREIATNKIRNRSKIYRNLDNYVKDNNFNVKHTHTHTHTLTRYKGYMVKAFCYSYDPFTDFPFNKTYFLYIFPFSYGRFIKQTNILFTRIYFQR